MSRILKRILTDKINSLLGSGNQFSQKTIINNYNKKCLLAEELQNVAIEIGTSIENAWKGQEQVVHILEDYCEHVYQITTIEPKDKIIYISLINQINSDIDHLKIMFEKEIPNKLEIVFLPYKAAMWDSLESVYMAAKEDKDCDPYVIPIPFYDKNKDGSLGKRYYEGEVYPEYVKITSYENYDIKQHYPDMIFFHNPYDGCNTLTSVHPEFYAKHLRNYTNELIYIPYFIHQNDMVQEKYCVLPGTMYASKVILQSEEVRKQYIKAYKKALQGTILSEQADEKFLALGSPKLDKLDRKNQSIEYNLPEEWKDICRRKEKTGSSL